MNMIRVSRHDLPNPAKRIGELESELLRVRGELEALKARELEREELMRGMNRVAAQRERYYSGRQIELEAERDAQRAAPLPAPDANGETA